MWFDSCDSQNSASVSFNKNEIGGGAHTFDFSVTSKNRVGYRCSPVWLHPNSFTTGRGAVGRSGETNPSRVFWRPFFPAILLLSTSLLVAQKAQETIFPKDAVHTETKMK